MIAHKLKAPHRSPFFSILKQKPIRFSIFLMVMLSGLLVFESNSLKLTTEIEFYLQDRLVKWRNRNHPKASEDIALISVRKETIERYDGAPPPRATLATLVSALNQSGASTIAFDFTFEMNRRGTTHLAEASKQVNQMIYGVECYEASNARDNHSSRLEFPLFEVDELNGAPEDNYTLKRIPHEDLRTGIGHLGHIMLQRSGDGARRHIPLLIRIGDRYYPALSLLAVCLFKDVPLDGTGVTVKWGKYVLLDNHSGWKCKIPIDKKGRMQINYIGDVRHFGQDYSFGNLERDLDLERVPSSWKNYFAGKLVLIGNIDNELDSTSTPFSRNFPGVAIHATAIDNILRGEFVHETSPWLTMCVTLCFTIGMVALQFWGFYRKVPNQQRKNWFWVCIGLGVFFAFVLSYVGLAVTLFYVWGRFLAFLSPLMAMQFAWMLVTSYCYVEQLRGEYVYRQQLTEKHHTDLSNLVIKLHHDIKNDLNSISGLAAFLGQYQLPPEKVNEKTSRIIKVSQRIAKTVERVNNAIVEKSHEKLKPCGDISPLNLNSLVDTVIEEDIRPYPLLAIDWKPPKDPPILKCNKESLHKAIRNLVVNAREAMPNGGKITIRIEQTEKEIKLRIRDTGHGIPLEIRDRIFDEFVTGKTWGNGMGLAQVKETVEGIHHGKVNVESEVGRGTEFTLIFRL
jgi:signal transduction histidine kinase